MWSLYDIYVYLEGLKMFRSIIFNVSHSQLGTNTFPTTPNPFRPIPPQQLTTSTTDQITGNNTPLLTPWCRILFEKLWFTQLVKKYPFLWNPKVHYHVHKSPPLDPILSQPNPVHPIDPYHSKVQLNVILPPTPRSSRWSLPFSCPNQNPLNVSPLPPCMLHVLPTSSSLI
jgi:hypothetical protein